MTTGRKVCLLFVVLGLLVIIANVPKEVGKQGAQQADPVTKPLGKPYSVISQNDIGMADRSKYEWRIIAPEAVTFDERALTVMKAAEELRQKQMVQVARVFLEPDQAAAGKGYAVATAVFAIDGKGFSGAENKTWEVSATKEKPELAAVSMVKYKDE